MVTKAFKDRIHPSHRKLQTLINEKNPNDIFETFKNITACIQGADFDGVLSFRVADKNIEVSAFLDTKDNKYILNEGVSEKKPDLEVHTNKETWMEMASGVVSPWKALVNKKILLRGNIELAAKLTSRLAVIDK